MTEQLKVWEGEFGNAFADRMGTDWRVRLPAFREALGGLHIQSALEVGCNRGRNLVALTELLGEDSDVVGIEPNRYALELARAFSPKTGVLRGCASDLPFGSSHFDLVITAGVLIHIAIDNLPAALREIHRVSRRYILAVEYFAETETSVSYRGHDNLLWKRDFRAHYQAEFPDLAVIREGAWGPECGFDKAELTHWWLFEKPTVNV